MRLVLAVARPYLARLAGAALLGAAAELAGLALMATAAWLLITAAGQPPLPSLTVAIVLVRALAIGRGVLRYTERLTGHDAVLRLLTEVRSRVFAALSTRLSVHDRSGDLLSRMVSDVDAVQDLFLRVLVPSAAAALVGVAAIAGTAIVSPAAAVALAGGLLLVGVALPVFAAGLTRRTAELVAPLRGALAADAVDLTQGAAELAAFGATATATARANARASRLARLEARLATAGAALDAAGTLVAAGTTVAVVAVASWTDVAGVVIGVLAIGTLAAVEASLALLSATRRWAEVRSGLNRISALLAVPGEADLGDQPAPDEPITVTVRQARVRYRSAATPALDGVDLTLTPGRRVAVIDPSGAGKSTLAVVVAGLLAVDANMVTVNGRPLSAFRDDARHRMVSGLLAEAYVFHATVRDNLLLGRPDADTTQLDAACAAAGLGDWVRMQPAGYDTVVGEDGAQLSGGQRQRLALARALLSDPAVLVLDEPTEGLDPTAADEVLASVLAAAPDQAVLLVTHRLHGLSRFDEVVVIEAGRITQRGRHDELVATPGWYRDQWLAQEAADRGHVSLT